MALWVIIVLMLLMLTELDCAQLKQQLVELKQQCRLKAKGAWGRHAYALMKTGTGNTTSNLFQGRQSQFALSPMSEWQREWEREMLFLRRTIEEWRNRILTDEDVRLFHTSPDDNDEVCSSCNVLCLFILVESFNEGRSQLIHAQQRTHTHTHTSAQWLLIDRNTPGCR